MKKDISNRKGGSLLTKMAAIVQSMTELDDISCMLRHFLEEM